MIERGDTFAEVLDLLRKRGVGLPENTTPANFMDYLRTALVALSHHEGGGTASDTDLDQGAGEEQPVLMSTLGGRVSKSHAAWIKERARGVSVSTPATRKRAPADDDSIAARAAAVSRA